MSSKQSRKKKNKKAKMRMMKRANIAVKSEAASTKLVYRVAPDSAFLNTSVRIVITATNTTSSDIIFSDSDEIIIAFPSSMVSSQKFSGSTPEKSGYTVSPTVGAPSFSVTVSFGNVVIRPNDTLIITFDQVPIVNVVGSPSVAITEKMGSTNSTNLPFSIKAAGLGIIAWLDKLIVGQSETTQLNWYTSGGTSVIISGFPTGTGQKQFEISDKLTSTPVYVPEGYPNWPYTATVYSSSSHVDQLVSLQQNPPMINEYSSVPLATQELAINETAELTWATQFASSVILTTPLIPNARQKIPAIPLTVSPGKDLQQAYSSNYEQLPATADYTLTVNGYKQAAVGDISFKIKPITLVYFKYADLEKTQIKFQTDPVTTEYKTWKFISGDVNQFVINQPGSVKDIFYLGVADTVHPQIQYFESTANAGKFDLTWTTQNLNQLVLTPGNIPIASGSINSGTLTVDTAGTYTLTGTTASGLIVISILEVS